MTEDAAAVSVLFNGNIVGEEEKVLKLLGKCLRAPIKYGEEAALLLIRHQNELRACTLVDQIHGVSPMICEWLQSQVLANHLAKIKRDRTAFAAKGHHRSLWVATGRLRHHETVNKSKEPIRNFHGEIHLACAGLLTHMAHNKYGAQKEPVTVSILNALPPSKDLGLPHDVIAPHHWDNMQSLGLAVVGERLAVQMNSPMYAVLCRATPLAIDARAYWLGVNAPLIAGGYLPEVPVTFRNLQVLKPRPASDLQEMMTEVREETAGNTVTFYDAMPAGDDGSGRYHPDCPHMAHLVASHGLVPFQWRALDFERGLFLKGIIIPCESSLDDEGAPCITASWKQVKGRWKDEAAKRAAADMSMVRPMHIGILRDWDKKRYMGGCFELLENIAAVQGQDESDDNYEARKTQILEDTWSLVDEAMADLGKDGIEGLLATLAKDDKMLSLVVKLLARARQQGIMIDPMGIERVKNALNTKLRNRLWRIAQGAGIEGRQLVMIIDASLEPGECVTAHHRVGMELACWRFPLVLAQGLKTLKVVEARPHQLARGEIVSQCIYMNPQDVLDQQGDDDGDIVAVSTDVRIRRLFANKVDSRRFQIEPKGVKLTMTVGSQPGLDYLRDTPMGQVGVMTMNRAKLLAAGDIMGALAMSVLVQECIDKAKRKVRWTDWERACVLDNWDEIDGVWHIHAADTDHNFLDQRKGLPKDIDPEELPLMMVQKWVKSRLEMFGCNKDQSALGWRKNQGELTNYKGEVDVVDIHKQIDPGYWVPSRCSQNGYLGGNLVHEAFDRAWSRWQLIADEFKGQAERGDVRTLLLRLLAEQGQVSVEPQYTWPQYMNVRHLAGITEFSEHMKEAMQIQAVDSDGSPNKDRYSQIEAAYVLLQARLRTFVQGDAEEGIVGQGVQGLLDIWCMETTDTYRVAGTDGETTAWYTTNREDIPKNAKYSRVNNPNHAINCVCWEGSPVMALLEISGQDACSYMTSERLRTITDYVFTKPDAFVALSEILWRQGSKPGEHERETGRPAWSCESCRKILQTQVVRKFRAIKGRGEKAFLGRLVGQLNLGDRTQVVETSYRQMGVNVAALLALDEESLRLRLESLQDTDTKHSKVEIKAITKILSGEGIS